MSNYSLRTNKSWQAIMRGLSTTFRMWGISTWQTNLPRGAVLERINQTEEERTVVLTYEKEGKTINLSMGRQSRAVDNLRVLYLVVDSMRLNEKRGIADVMQKAYLQLTAPVELKNPYEVLHLYHGAPLSVCEAMYKELVKKAHPDAGGSVEQMKELNQAIKTIRGEQGNDA